MLLKNISLQNFRSFAKSSFSFSSGTTVIVGPNAIGKTNLLESVYLLSMGKSFKTGLEEEMVRNKQEIARVKGGVDIGDKRGDLLEVILTRGVFGGEKVGRKKLTVNKIAKRLIDYQGNLRVVLFGPWDMGLITDAPSSRRRFLDNVLSQADREYRRSLLSYERGVRQRNRILERIRDEGVSRSQLIFWDRLLIKNGDYISQKREELITFINLADQLPSTNYSLLYDKSSISEARLEQYAVAEVASAMTLVGPHRDDVKFETQDKRYEIGGRDLAIYGSRGEQRMAILWVKLTELAFIESKTEDRPILLLDDIFSELDPKHRDVVADVVGKQQTILTTADPHTLIGLGDVERIELG